jgi:membrane protein implicated in regulation of membrane protease activity
MRKRSWSFRIFVRYMLFQVPGVVLLYLLLILARRVVAFPTWLIWSLVAFWVIKDLILFPAVWRAYDQERRDDASSMIGSRGIAEDRLNPSGYIRVHGELWKAEVMGGSPSIGEGEQVTVREIRGLTLLVEPDRGSYRLAAPS